MLLKHPRILQFLGIYDIDGVTYLVSPFAEYGSLPGYLKRRPEVDRGRLVRGSSPPGTESWDSNLQATFRSLTLQRV